MEWQVKIEGNPKQRILVNFDPQEEQIIFKGQYRTSVKDWTINGGSHNEWVDFSTEIYSMNIDLETIQELLLKVYNVMNERIVIHEDLTKSFGIIKTIEIQKLN